MKRCPECRRDYYDDTMIYCLDDGNALLEGPASARPGDEPATAILSEPGAIATGFPSDEPQTAILSEPGAIATGFRDGDITRPQVHTNDQTAIFPHGAEAEPQGSLGGLVAKPQGKVGSRRRQLAVFAVLVVLLAGGFFVYRYFSPTNQINSIAVMPFVNESGNSDIEYLTDGMTETLISSLTQLPNLNVKARSSVFRYKGKETDAKTLGKELSVQAILNGRVAQRGEQLTLSLELVDVKTENAIWSQQYTRKQTDLVSLQSEIARDVSGQLKSKLSGADEARVTKTSTVNPEAYQAYLKGRYYWNRRTAEDLKKAIEQFRLATVIDPNYALAYSGLADSYAIFSDFAGNPASETSPQARAFAERAIAIDDQLAEPHATLGILNVQEFRWDDALWESKRAVELNPNYPTGIQWYGSILLDTGKYEEAAAMIERAHELDPLSGAISDALSNIYQVQNNYEAAIENCNKFIELDPTFPASYRNLGLYYSKLGRHSEAVSVLEKGLELGNRASWLLGDLGYVYAAAGKRDAALGIVHELEIQFAQKRVAGRYVAAVYAGLGQKDKAMEWLEKDFQNKNGRLAEIRWTIPFESLHDDPRYKDLLKQMGLSE